MMNAEQINRVICDWSLRHMHTLAREELDDLVHSLLTLQRSLPPQPVVLQERTDGKFVYMSVVASTPEQVARVLETYLKEYPPQGYRTEIKTIPFLKVNGKWEARVERYASCD